MGRIEDKIDEIREYLNDLKKLAPNTLEEYLSLLEKRLACERAFEKIIEAVNDLAILVIKDRGFAFPEDEIGAFDILESEEVISEKLTDNLKKAKGMRNFLVHQYSKINDEIVFEAIKNSIERDALEFLGKLR